MTKSKPASKKAAAPPLLYRRIRDELESRIRSGDWPPGHRLPYEYELMEQYDCSRMTVNKVMAGLAAEGLIERRRKAGSFVSRPRGDSALLLIPVMREEVEARGAAYGYRLLERTELKAPPVDFKEAGFTGAALLLRALHLADATPFAYEERLINLKALPEAARGNFEKTSPGTWLMEQAPWTEASHNIKAVNAGRDVAKKLAIAEGTACLRVERFIRRASDNISMVRQYYPGELYQVSATFTAQIRASAAKPVRVAPD